MSAFDWTTFVRSAGERDNHDPAAAIKLQSMNNVPRQEILQYLQRRISAEALAALGDTKIEAKSVITQIYAGMYTDSRHIPKEGFHLSLTLSEGFFSADPACETIERLIVERTFEEALKRHGISNATSQGYDHNNKNRLEFLIPPAAELEHDKKWYSRIRELKNEFRLLTPEEQRIKLEEYLINFRVSPEEAAYESKRTITSGRLDSMIAEIAAGIANGETEQMMMAGEQAAQITAAIAAIKKEAKSANIKLPEHT